MLFCSRTLYIQSKDVSLLSKWKAHHQAVPLTIQIAHSTEHSKRFPVFVQGFCVLSKWRVGAWLGGVQQRSSPPPSLLLWRQASSVVPGHWPLHPTGTESSHSTALNRFCMVFEFYFKHHFYRAYFCQPWVFSFLYATLNRFYHTKKTLLTFLGMQDMKVIYNLIHIDMQSVANLSFAILCRH